MRLLDSCVVWTSDSDLIKGEMAIPEQLGRPRADQLQGTPLERMCELAARACYDSLGRGRSSAEYHKHILQVGHGSVYEHGVVTVRVNFISIEEAYLITMSLLNRPHLFVDYVDFGLEVTLNLRHVLEWENKSDSSFNYNVQARRFFAGLLQVVSPLAPAVLGNIVPKLPPDVKPIKVEVCLPTRTSQAHITCYLSGSRGWSHEQVRHRHAMSQRSSRYCDESESPWAWHPLVRKLLGIQKNGFDGVDGPPPDKKHEKVRNALRMSEHLSRSTYEDAVDLFEADLIKDGADKQTARKQARGAARGVLGNALHTEMIYTAPVSAWHFMLYWRCSIHADAEIRVLFSDLLPKLQKTSLGVWFNHIELEPSPDGVGSVLTKDSMKMLETQYKLKLQ